MSIDSIWFSNNNFCLQKIPYGTQWSSGWIENVKLAIPKYSCLKLVS